MARARYWSIAAPCIPGLFDGGGDHNDLLVLDHLPGLLRGIDDRLRKWSLLKDLEVLLELPERRHTNKDAVLSGETRVVAHPTVGGLSERDALLVGCLGQHIEGSKHLGVSEQAVEQACNRTQDWWREWLVL